MDSLWACSCARRMQSLRLWKRINPGILPHLVDTPRTTNAATFLPRNAVQEPSDMRHHLQKTDFSQYTEAVARAKAVAGLPTKVASKA